MQKVTMPDLEQVIEKIKQMPDTAPSLECALCRRERQLESDKYCRDCRRIVDRAKDFRADHFHVPARYVGATLPEYDFTSALWFGVHNGTGKTHSAYAHALEAGRQNPRLTIAAYKWPVVLMELRRGYNRSDDRADGIVDALRKADIAMLDDVGAEKITDSNQAWIQEILYVILDERWEENRTTYLTTNLVGDGLAEYLGNRIASRIGGMCRMIPMDGTDRRLQGAL